MAVAEHGRLAGGVQPVGVDQRMLAGRDDLDVLHARVPQALGDELGGALDIGACSGRVLMLGIRMNSFSSSRKRSGSL